MKKFLTVFFTFTLYFNLFNQAYAGAAEKWEIVENVYDTSKNVVNVTAKKVSQQAANSGVYKVQVPVSASALGKTVKTMMWTGIAVASVQAMLEGIGWIIDTGSKTIKRQKIDPDLPDQPYFWCAQPYTACSASASSAAMIFIGQMLENSNLGYSSMTIKDVNQTTKRVSFYVIDEYKNTVLGGNFDVNWTKNPAYDPTAQPPQWEIMSDSELGNEILGKGENPVPLSGAVTDAYSPNNPVGESEPAPKATNDALNNANPQPEKEPEGKAETDKEKDQEGNETGKTTTKFELPKFCEWAPAVCDFFTVQKQDNKEIKENQKEDIAQNKTFFEKVTDFFAFMTSDPEEPEKVNIPTTDLDEKSFLLNVITVNGAYCPADKSIEWDTPVGHFSKTVSYQNFCDASEWFGYLVLAAAYYMGALIVVRDS